MKKQQDTMEDQVSMGLTMLHNDRRFDVENSEHIDAERTKFNVYWDCYQGYSLPNDENKRARFTFSEVEKAYYVENYSGSCGRSE